MIGVFDSGIGGLTVVRELIRRAPEYGIIYFGDTARAPYGTKSRSVVERFSVQDADFLVSEGAEVIIVACNTASALAMDALRERVRVPVFGVVTPAVSKAAEVTSGRVGVIGTRGTVNSGVYETEMKKISPDVIVLTQACPLFVPLVEECWHEKKEAETIAGAYLNKLKLQNIDTLVLGCTHYPFLRSVIRRVVGKQVNLVDPGGETVAHFMVWLKEHPHIESSLRRTGLHRFYASDRTEQFADLAKCWLGSGIKLEEHSLE